MKKTLIIMVLLLLCVGAFAQTSKQEARKNLTVKEWNCGDAGKGPRFLDHVTKYDAKGRKIEDIEYTSSNTMKARWESEKNAIAKCRGRWSITSITSRCASANSSIMPMARKRNSTITLRTVSCSR